MILPKLSLSGLGSQTQFDLKFMYAAEPPVAKRVMN